MPCRFSALQRAENSSIGWMVEQVEAEFVFQCSSASRKFLNEVATQVKFEADMVSVLFSEPKIPQCGVALRRVGRCRARFSALQRAENSSMGVQ